MSSRSFALLELIPLQNRNKLRLLSRKYLLPFFLLTRSCLTMDALVACLNYYIRSSEFHSLLYHARMAGRQTSNRPWLTFWWRHDAIIEHRCEMWQWWPRLRDITLNSHPRSRTALQCAVQKYSSRQIFLTQSVYHYFWQKFVTYSLSFQTDNPIKRFTKYKDEPSCSNVIFRGPKMFCKIREWLDIRFYTQKNLAYSQKSIFSIWLNIV